MTEDSFLYAQSLHRRILALRSRIEKIDKFLTGNQNDKRVGIQLYDKEFNEFSSDEMTLTGAESVEVTKLMRSKCQDELTVLQEEFNNL